MGGEGHGGPDRGVGVLPAVFPHAGHVAADVAGIESGGVEGRVEQLDEPASRRTSVRPPPAWRGAHAPDCVSLPVAAGQHRPALRDRVDLAFGVRGRAQRRAVVEIGAAIPGAVPAVLFDALAQSAPARPATLGEVPGPRAPAPGAELPQHFAQEEAQPDALALALMPTRFMPSFQSPEPISGRPCSPKRRPCRIARTQCSYRLRCIGGAAGQVVVGVVFRIDRTAFEERHRLRPARRCRRCRT
jgi:hypothetical protein